MGKGDEGCHGVEGLRNTSALRRCVTNAVTSATWAPFSPSSTCCEGWESYAALRRKGKKKRGGGLCHGEPIVCQVPNGPCPSGLDLWILDMPSHRCDHFGVAVSLDKERRVRLQVFG